MTAWERDLAQALALHDLAIAGHALVPSHARIETAREGVVAAIDRAVAAGVPEADVDVVLRRHADEATVAHTTTPSPGRPPAMAPSRP